MKVRNGFVSNSSSSSFIVAWNKKPESVEEVKNILFGDAKTHYMYDYTIGPTHIVLEHGGVFDKLFNLRTSHH